MNPLASSRQWHLAKRPTGTPTTGDVRFVTVELPPLDENEVRVQNEFISVDPYMRGRMNDVKSYVPPFQLDRVMDADAVGRVIESRSPDLEVGQLVQHFQGWRDVAQGDASRFTAREEVPGIAPSVSTRQAPGLTMSWSQAVRSATDWFATRGSGLTPSRWLAIPSLIMSGSGQPRIR